MDKHFILVGYGDVGRGIARFLKERHLSFVVIDENEAKLKDKGFDYVAGNAVDEEVLVKAGMQDASTVIIVLNNDEDIIFTTLVARNINPHSIIIARANATQSVVKIYRAGADYVASLSIVAGQILARIVFENEKEETITMVEGLKIEKYHVTEKSPLIGKNITETGIRSRTGCTVIGIEENGNTSTDISPDVIIKDGMTLALIGNDDQVLKFKDKYGRT